MKCSICGREELLPFKCKYCGGYYCAEHRLPEKHNCLGAIAASSPYEKELKEVKMKMRAESEALRAIARRRSLTEFGHIMVSVILVALVGTSLIGYSSYIFMRPHIVLIYLAGFTLSYLLHELAHRIVARRNNVKAYFKLDPIGSLLTLVSALPMLPIKFISPGAVVLSTPTTMKVVGSVAYWGPATNLILSIILYILSSVLKTLLMPLEVYNILMVLAKFNAFISLFNLIPLGPFDGLKIIRWSMIRWATLFSPSLILLIFTW
ncbi:MAG: AN1-type zinc finger domain-containing protein [Candidatus Caldarchaeales archaeon]